MFHRVNPKTILLAGALLGGALLAAVTPASAQIAISVQIEPPVLPVYAQPPITVVGDIWTPGYWAYDAAAGYYWVPGTWVQPPAVGLLWTPPYWGFEGGAYLFHPGYWGPHVGFYGGINYGFGYGGNGYQGGRWDGNNFRYNVRANNFGGVHVGNVYSSRVTIRNVSRVSFAGGPHGLHSEPTQTEQAVGQEAHRPVTADQERHATAAAARPELAVRANNGRPAIAATRHPAEFEGKGVVAARPEPARAAPHAAARPKPVKPEEQRK